jgi:hypothetical protein
MHRKRKFVGKLMELLRAGFRVWDWGLGFRKLAGKLMGLLRALMGDEQRQRRLAIVRGKRDITLEGRTEGEGEGDFGTLNTDEKPKNSVATSQSVWLKNVP